MNELDFSARQILVVGGSSGIGNGIAQAFRAKGARVHVCGTRASAADYSLAEGSHLDGLDYAQRARSRISSRRSIGSMCWCWRRVR
jgi:3-oxoacyl-[acyl-carrier protein] reductase